jgi:hypothetical protein
LGALTLDGATAFELELGAELELELGLLRLERRSPEVLSTALLEGGALERPALLDLGALFRGAEVVLGREALVFFVTLRAPVVSPTSLLVREVDSIELREAPPALRLDLDDRPSDSSPPTERLEDERDEDDPRDAAVSRVFTSSWRTRGETKLELFDPRDSLATSDFCAGEPAARLAVPDFFANSIARGSCFAMFFGAPLFGTPACSRVGEAE